MIIYQFGINNLYQLNPARRSLLREGQAVSLNRKAFETLCLLVENASTIITREQLMEKVWNGISVDPAVVDQNIYALRRALKEDRLTRRYIETVRGIGFMFVAPVTTVLEGAEDQNRDPYRRVSATLAGKYLLTKYIGRGGMGAVYKAIAKPITGVSNEGFPPTFAIKLLKPDLVMDHPDYALLFEREVEVVRKLEHPHIVRLIDSAATDDGIPFMVMEWLTGKSLEDHISDEQLSIERIVDILYQVCEAFHFAHSNGVIHLDIKPSNIFLLSVPNPDFIKVIDFGMSRVIRQDSGTTASRFLGTYQYCSPEHFGGKLSRRSDIYSLGVTLYQMLTGVLPFGSSYVHAKMYPNLELPPVPPLHKMRPEIGPEVDEIINKAISRDPEARQNDVRQFFKEFATAVQWPKLGDLSY
jgi:eukaryotic-like serine/threonine-protein kinase